MNRDDYINRQGECPKCGGYNLDYGAIQYTDEMCYYPYKCKKCGQEGQEWYRLEFQGHNIFTEDGDEIIL